MSDLDASEVVRDVLARPMQPEQKEAVEAVLGELQDSEDSLMTMAVMGMVQAAADGNVSAFNALVDLYGDGAGANTPRDSVLAKVLADE